MQGSRRLTLVLFVVVSGVDGIAGCSGGGSAAAAPPARPAATPTPSPAASALASGRVVDFDTDAGLLGVPVRLAPYVRSGPFARVATSSFDGSFSFAAAPGSYLLAIGSDSSSDTRATVHVRLALSAGPNAIAMGSPNPEPDVTLAPSQASGTYRLAVLDAGERDCFTGANAGRASHGLPSLTLDQWLLEDARAVHMQEVAQQTDTPVGGNYLDYGPPLGEFAATSSEDFPTCSSWTNVYSYTRGTPPYSAATDPTAVWYSASYGAGSGRVPYGVQLWSRAPR